MPSHRRQQKFRLVNGAPVRCGNYLQPDGTHLALHQAKSNKRPCAVCELPIRAFQTYGISTRLRGLVCEGCLSNFSFVPEMRDVG
jgi:hypothetical protein